MHELAEQCRSQRELDLNQTAKSIRWITFMLMLFVCSMIRSGEFLSNSRNPADITLD